MKEKKEKEKMEELTRIKKRSNRIVMFVVVITVANLITSFFFILTPVKIMVLLLTLGVIPIVWRDFKRAYEITKEESVD